MVSKEVIRSNLDNCLVETDFLGLQNGKRGKVRDIYDLGDHLILVTTDRQSAFDRILAAVPFKGQVLNQTSAFWFSATEDIVQNHVLEVPDPNVTIAKKCQPIALEMVVRGFLTGSTSTSAWTRYKNGERDINGNILPEGMVKNQQFDSPILTPTTKSEEHDKNMSPSEIISKGIVSRDMWEHLSQLTLSLFVRGQEIASKHGLILVDTKYEFGIDEKGRITLIDEIHTPDSSRYWLADSYGQRFVAGQEPENIDKEFLRLWFREHCDPYKDQTLPAAPEDLVVELSRRYIKLYEMITGEEFALSEGETIQERIMLDLADRVR